MYTEQIPCKRIVCNVILASVHSMQFAGNPHEVSPARWENFWGNDVEHVTENKNP